MRKARPEYMQKWREANPDKIREHNATYRKKHQAAIAKRLHDYHIANLEEQRKHRRDYARADDLPGVRTSL